MGTRNLTMVFADGKYKLAQYCQWDGYPEGQGETVLEFARDKMDRATFLANLDKCREIDSEEMQRRYASVGADGSGWVNMEVADRFKAKWPQLNRDMGADVLELIQGTPDGLDLHSHLSFAGDGLFCEWAYVLDFDKGALEVYRGFNKKPLEASERFASFKSENGYTPIKFAKSWPLDALPTNEEFFKALVPPEDEEEAA
jgi:hypothetical protein